MNAPVFAGNNLGRFSSWFGTPPAASVDRTAVADADARRLVERRLYDAIGDFLFTHGLSPTPAHFDIGHAYLSGSDATIAHEIDAMLADHGTLDLERVARLLRPEEAGTQALAGLADQLETRLAECLDVTARVHGSVRDDAPDIAYARLQRDVTDTLDHIAGLTRDVLGTTRLVQTELQHARRHTEQLHDELDHALDAAERDHLTGLPNRRGLERRIVDLIARRGADDRLRRVAIALCDIDDFKLVNDVHGHQAGDRVLRFVGGFLSSELGRKACVSRHGGEEFAVLFEDHSPSEAMLLLDAVRARLAAHSLINQAPIGRVTFSAGIAALGDDRARAMEDADIALYQAKRSGKNAVALAPTSRR